jgi:hypothetical protein
VDKPPTALSSAALSFVLVASLGANASDFSCPKLSTSDAHVLTQKQLAARICSYVAMSDKIKNDVDKKTANTEMSPEVAIYALHDALDCLFTAAATDKLYKERFGKNSGCVPYDKAPATK